MSNSYHGRAREDTNSLTNRPEADVGPSCIAIPNTRATHLAMSRLCEILITVGECRQGSSQERHRAAKAPANCIALIGD